MIYFASDMHGDVTEALEEYNKISSADDLIIVLGDLGMWFEDKITYRIFNEYMLSIKNAVAFVDGNHENHPKINSFPIEVWNGGKVHRISDNIVHLMRGEIFEIDGKSFFAMGGCASSQKWINAGKVWYDGENPSKDEIQYAKQTLSKYSNTVDYVLTHKYLREDIEATNENSLEELIRYIKENVKYKKWYFGHDHIDEKLDEKHICVYDRLTKIE